MKIHRLVRDSVLMEFMVLLFPLITKPNKLLKKSCEHGFNINNINSIKYFL